MGLKEALENRIGAIINGLGDHLVLYDVKDQSKGSAGEVVGRNVIRGTITVLDSGTKNRVEVPARQVYSFQSFK